MIRLKYLTSYSVQNLDTSCMYPYPSPKASSTDNDTGDCVDIVVWSIIETYTAVICACLITIRPLLAKYIPSIFRGILVSDTPSWPYVTSRPFSTAHPQSLNSKSVGPGLIENPESAAELQSSESGIVCMDEESSHDDGYSKKG